MIADRYRRICLALWLVAMAALTYGSLSPIIVGATALLGIDPEFGQSFVPGREPSIGDVVANSAGVIVAVLLGLAVRR